MHLRLLAPGTTLLPVFAALFLLSTAAAAAVNRTIDDSFGDSVTGQNVSYLPSTGVWDNQDCSPSHCHLLPDVSQAFEATYTAATYFRPSAPISITIHFVGTAIYVFFILANNVGDAATFTAANFTLDQATPQLFTHNPNATSHDFQFNQLVFKQENLDNVNHTLVISSSGSKSSYVNFDYAIYTVEDNTTTSPVVKESGPTTMMETVTKLSTISTPDTTVVSSGSSATATAMSSSPAPSSATLNTSVPSTSTVELGQSGRNSKTRVTTGVVVGGVIGGLAVVVLMIFAVYLLRLTGKDSRNIHARRLFLSAHAPPPY